jgi:2,3,4,5-tetrahydropyridine-2-carboxylate N-succinyltransferase
MSLRERIEALSARDRTAYTSEDRATWEEFKAALNCGKVRTAERSPGGQWRVNGWVRLGILVGFQLGSLNSAPAETDVRFFEEVTCPMRALTVADKVRVVPGGSSIRDGVYVAPGVVCMPPMFINFGAYIDAGTMIDSHASVGSGAQIGKRVHLSAAAQVGGMSGSVDAEPVIIEDDVLVGGGCGVYEGTLVREGAVLAAGTILTRSTPVYDLPRGLVYGGTEESRLEIPAGAVVVPGSRALEKGIGRKWEISLYAAVIVKYRDAKTEGAIRLEPDVR